MKTKYQIILIGEENNQFIQNILQIMFHHIDELGLNKNSILIIRESDFRCTYKKNAPTFCLYFGDITNNCKNSDILDDLINDAVLILPVVSDLKLVVQSVPESLRHINCFELSSPNEVEKLVACMLEGLSLLRLSRRIFISYKREESTAIAIQLFEQLEKNGFDVFLDTHSIRPGEPFQDELWHRMTDADVVVLLNTPGFLKSEWTTEELARANSMSIGILQLIFPNHQLEREAELSIPIQLKCSDFIDCSFNNNLTSEIVSEIVSQVESLRARSLAARQDNIVTEFISSARKKIKKVDLQPEKIITVMGSNKRKYVIIPTIGVPQAFTYHQSENLISLLKLKKITDIYLLYDHRNIREKWLNHLEWLNNYLPVKSIKIVEVEEWLTKI